MRPVPRARETMFLRAAIGIASMLFAVACDSPSQPSRAQLEIVGPTTVAPGETAQAQAFLVSGGSRRDVTAGATWSSSNPAVLSVSAGGVLTGGGVGDSTLQARHADYQTAKEVIVVPAGTFRLSGQVSWSFSGPTTGLSVQLIGADGNVRTTTTDQRGFRFYGVAGPVQLRTSASLHYVYQTQLDVNDHVTHNIRLLPINLSGTYTLTLSASASCSSLLPEAMRVRTYRAVIVQEDSHGLLNVTLEGAFVGGPARFGGAIDGSDRVVFWIPGGVDRDPSVAETIGPETWFIPYGELRGTIFADRLAGTLNGGMYVESMASGQRTITECKAPDHDMVFSR